MDEQTTDPIYEPPTLVEVGEFSEDTLGASGNTLDSNGLFEFNPGP